MSAEEPVPNFTNKFGLALEAAKRSKVTNAKIIHSSEIAQDTFYKWKRGDGYPTQENLTVLVSVFEKLLDLPQDLWRKDLGDFETVLAGYNTQSGVVSGPPKPIFELRSREKHPDLLLEQMSGYWAAFYRSASRTDQVVVSRDLVELAGTHQSGYVGCRITDTYFQYEGLCVAFGSTGLLQWILEKKGLYNEVLCYMTTKPDRTPPVLFGVMTCTSGGVDTHVQLPAAARVVMVRLGSTKAMRRSLSMNDTETREQLQDLIPRYVEIKELPEWLNTAISNILPANAVPSALRVETDHTPQAPVVASFIDELMRELPR
jgi:hypothetical protein